MSERASYNQLYPHVRSVVENLSDDCGNPGCRRVDEIASDRVVIVQHLSSEPLSDHQTHEYLLTRDRYSRYSMRSPAEQESIRRRQLYRHHLAHTAISASDVSVDRTRTMINPRLHFKYPNPLETPADLMSRMMAGVESLDGLAGLAPYYFDDVKTSRHHAATDGSLAHWMLNLPGNDVGQVIDGLVGNYERDSEVMTGLANRLSTAFDSRVYDPSVNRQRASEVLSALYERRLISSHLCSSPHAAWYATTTRATRDYLESSESEGLEVNAGQFASQFLKEYLQTVERDPHHDANRVNAVRNLIFSAKRQGTTTWESLVSLHRRATQTTAEPGTAQQWEAHVGPALLRVLDATLTPNADDEARERNVVCSDIVSLCIGRSELGTDRGYTMADLALRYPKLSNEHLPAIVATLRDHGFSAADRLYERVTTD